MADFLSIVTHNFKFLIDEFDYIVKRSEGDPDHFGNSVIRVETLLVGIDIVLDRGHVLVYLGLLTDPEDEWFDLCDVIPYFAPEIDPVYNFAEKLLWEESIKFQVERLAGLVKTYCTPILRGDFSMKNRIQTIRENREKKLIEEMKKKYPHQLRYVD